MTTEEAIHRASLRKHRHKGNYIETHEALLAEAEYLQQTQSKRDVKLLPMLLLVFCVFAAVHGLFMAVESFDWQIIKGWFA